MAEDKEPEEKKRGGGRPTRSEEYRRKHPAVRLRILQEQMNAHLDQLHATAIEAFMPGGSVDQLAVNAASSTLHDLLATCVQMHAMFLQEHRKPWVLLEPGDMKREKR